MTEEREAAKQWSFDSREALSDLDSQRVKTH